MKFILCSNCFISFKKYPAIFPPPPYGHLRQRRTVFDLHSDFQNMDWKLSSAGGGTRRAEVENHQSIFLIKKSTTTLYL